MRTKLVTPGRLAGIAAALVVLAGIVLYLVPSNDYILLPDKARSVAPLVTVQGGHNPKDGGGIYFVDVVERPASIFEKLFPWIHTGSTLVPSNLIVPPGISDTAVRQEDLREMSISQRVAAAVALRHLGYHVVARPGGVVVAAIASNSHAVGVLHTSDVITAVNGTPTLTIARLRTQLAHVKPGQTVTVTALRDGRTRAFHIRTVADSLNKKRAIIGFAPEQEARIDLPLKVRIDVGNVGGPSAGLAFALEVLEKLGHNVDRGYRVAATGQIELNGGVAPIGGVKQKTYGVRAAHADVFLVPAGDNYREARRYAGGLRVIPVQSFQQALRALATLPPKR